MFELYNNHMAFTILLISGYLAFPNACNFACLWSCHCTIFWPHNHYAVRNFMASTHVHKYEDLFLPPPPP